MRAAPFAEFRAIQRCTARSFITLLSRVLAAGSHHTDADAQMQIMATYHAAVTSAAAAHIYRCPFGRLRAIVSTVIAIEASAMTKTTLIPLPQNEIFIAKTAGCRAKNMNAEYGRGVDRDTRTSMKMRRGRQKNGIKHIPSPITGMLGRNSGGTSPKASDPLPVNSHEYAAHTTAMAVTIPNIERIPN